LHSFSPRWNKDLSPERSFAPAIAAADSAAVLKIADDIKTAARNFLNYPHLDIGDPLNKALEAARANLARKHCWAR
jgi:hypothetical protein